MVWYVIRRLLLVIPTLVGVAIAVFFLIRVMPGDVVVVKLRADGAAVSEETIQAERKRLGLDKPLYEQFGEYMLGLPRLDLGKSLWTGESVTKEIALRMPVSFQIAIMAGLIAVLIAIPLGTISALRENSWLDHMVRVLAIAGIATPSFWLGIMSLILVLNISAIVTGKPWLPPIDYVSFWQDPLRNLSMVLLPAITVGYRYSAVTMRLTRSAMLEVLREDYIRTARAKGLLEQIIINRHALKSAFLSA